MHKILVTVTASEQGNKMARKHLGHGRTVSLRMSLQGQVTGREIRERKEVFNYLLI